MLRVEHLDIDRARPRRRGSDTPKSWRYGRPFAATYVYHLSTYYVSRLLHDVTKLERALDGRSRSASWTLARQARKRGRRAVRIAGSVALQRPEAFRLAGRVQWLLGAPERALRWWAKSLAEAERLGARPALARTYMEIGERLAGSREPHMLNGMGRQGVSSGLGSSARSSGWNWTRHSSEPPDVQRRRKVVECARWLA